VATVSDIMTSDVVTVDPEDSLRDALDAFRAEDVTGAPVTRNDEVVGVVSVTDILEFEATNPGVPVSRQEQTEWGEFEAPEIWEEGRESPSAFFVDFWSDVGAEITARFEESDSPEWDLLENHIVGEVMTRTVIGVSPETTIRDAARRMMDAEVQRILVLDDGELKGIVTSTDMVRAVAEGTV